MSAATWLCCRTIEPPKHGKISIDRGAGYSNFPQNNPRFDCNKNQSEGVKITYEPNRGFVGDNTLTVDILYADKSVSRRHYSIKVNPGPGDRTSARAKPQSSAQIIEVARVAVRDQRLRVANLFDLNPDCSVIGILPCAFLGHPKMAASLLRRAQGFRTIRRPVPAPNATAVPRTEKLFSICRNLDMSEPTL